MLKFFKTLSAGIALMLVSAVVLAAPSHAGDPVIDQAKADGTVGERIDGYLGIVTTVDPAVQRKVEEINAKRRGVYADTAASTGESLSAVARITGEKQIERAEPGEYYMDETGSWKQK